MDFSSQILSALVGGLVIGLSVTMVLLFFGRVTGISGIVYNVFIMNKKDWYWRVAFTFGLIVGGLLLQIYYPSSLENSLNHSSLRVMLAGFLVGFGALLGNGCTSGHGVCGISRFSLRSIIATVVFMSSGVVTVYLLGGIA